MTELTAGERVQALLFLAIAAATLTGLAVFLLGLSKEEDRVYFNVRFEGSVAGIAEKSRVMFQGVPCGEVMRIKASGPSSVQVTISVARWTPVTSSTVGFIATHSIVGPFHIELKNSDPDSPPVQEGWSIPGQSSLLQSFLATGQTLTEKMLVVLQNIEETTASHRQEQVFATVDSLRATLDALRGEVQTLGPEARATLSSLRATSDTANEFLLAHKDEIATLLQDLGRSSAAFRKFLEDGHLERLSAELSSEIARTGQRLDQTLGTVEGWLTDNAPGPYFDRATRSMETLITSLTTLTTALEAEGVSIMRTEISPLLKELRGVSAGLSRLVRLVAVEPRALLFGEPAREKPLPQSGGSR